jgi:hypothetical protein
MIARVETGMAFEALQALDAQLCNVASSVGALRLAMAEGLEALARCGGHHDLGFASVEGTRWSGAKGRRDGCKHRGRQHVDFPGHGRRRTKTQSHRSVHRCPALTRARA